MVLDGRKRRLEYDEAVAEVLPAIFRMVQESNTTLRGSCIRFIVAVLREGGIRSCHDSDETIAAAIKQARFRYSERQRLGTHQRDSVHEVMDEFRSLFFMGYLVPRRVLEEWRQARSA
jgi:hypothetical protein